MPTIIHRHVEAARDGTNPKVIGRMASGWAVLGDVQMLRGYCLLLPDPVVADLNALEGAARAQYLADVGTLGDVLLRVTGALRINYAILGNLEPALHTHLFPRYADEPEAMRSRPPFAYDRDAAEPFDAERHGPLMAEIRAGLDKLSG